MEICSAGLMGSAERDLALRWDLGEARFGWNGDGFARSFS